MKKEQIQQKFEEILTGLGFTFNPDNILKDRLVSKSDLIELMEFAFNLGLDVASENAEADFVFLNEGTEDHFQCLEEGKDYEVRCLKQSILRHKL